MRRGRALLGAAFPASVESIHFAAWVWGGGGGAILQCKMHGLVSRRVSGFQGRVRLCILLCGVWGLRVPIMHFTTVPNIKLQIKFSLESGSS